MIAFSPDLLLKHKLRLCLYEKLEGIGKQLPSQDGKSLAWRQEEGLRAAALNHEMSTYCLK